MNRQPFKNGKWENEINVADFIFQNYTEYEGDENFLAPPSIKTQKIWQQCEELILQENKEQKIDLNHLSGINNFAPGYIDKDNEVIVGLQTDEPLKRIINPYGGIRMAEQSLKAYGHEFPKELKEQFCEYRKTHNQGVFDVYTPEIRKARHAGLITGLPDAYGRGRIIGDYRRVPLYGINRLKEEKIKDYHNITEINDNNIRLREELAEQVRALDAMNEMAKTYGFDLSNPAETAKEAVQYLYLAYLAGMKQNNGAANSLGRVSTFLDIYIQRDLSDNIITEDEAQELIDQFVIKLRLIRHLRTPEYNELFGGDPTWVTEAIGGIAPNGKSLVTKNSFRFLHTLTNLGAAPEPNLTVLWDENLPENFQKYCAKMSIQSSAIQYENDAIMRPLYSNDYGIACCVSAMTLGKQMQFFGARCNLAKALLYAINEGKDEINGETIVPDIPKISSEYLNFEEVWANYEKVLKYVAKVYVDANNIIHYMHDKYAYESAQMALLDTNVEPLMAFGAAGFSVAADSLSAIKYAKVKPIRNEEGIAIDFEIDGKFPCYGNDDDKVDSIAVDLIEQFSFDLKTHYLYKDASPTLSILTITSNVMYGKKTGATPDGRKKGEPFAPGANPMHGRDTNGALASLNSVAKIPYKFYCQDGISNTFTMVPDTLGSTKEIQVGNLVAILNGYFCQGAHHLNVNVLNRETLLDAFEHPEKYSTLTIRVSGYAVRFCKLSKEQQLEVIQRTFH